MHVEISTFSTILLNWFNSFNYNSLGNDSLHHELSNFIDIGPDLITFPDSKVWFRLGLHNKSYFYRYCDCKELQWQDRSNFMHAFQGNTITLTVQAVTSLMSASLCLDWTLLSHVGDKKLNNLAKWPITKHIHAQHKHSSILPKLQARKAHQTLGFFSQSTVF